MITATPEMMSEIGFAQISSGQYQPVDFPTALVLDRDVSVKDAVAYLLRLHLTWQKEQIKSNLQRAINCEGV